MAGNSTISITFKISDDGKGFKQLSLDAKGFKKVIGETVKEAERLNSSAINFAAWLGDFPISKTKTLTDCILSHARAVREDSRVFYYLRLLSFSDNTQNSHRGIYGQFSD